jgi:hypothetical protein
MVHLPNRTVESRNPAERWWSEMAEYNRSMEIILADVEKIRSARGLFRE